MKKKCKYKILLSFLFFVICINNMKAENIIELETNKSIINFEQGIIQAENGTVVKFEDVTIKSDFLEKLENENVLLASSNVIFTQGAQTIKAEQIKFNMDTKEAKIINSNGIEKELQLKFGGESTTREANGDIVIEKGWITPSPYETPNYKIESDKIILYPQKKIVLKNISLNIKGKKYFKIPYYVTSLKKESQRATLFPYVGYDSDRGYYGVMGFDYDKGQYFQGFVDVELSSKQNVAFKFSNDYTISEGNYGNIFINRFVIPRKNIQNEWDVKWTHKYISIPQKDKVDRNFYDFGYGIWDLSYENKTTNLMSTINGDKLKDNFGEYLNENKNIGLYNIRIAQELGRNGEFNLEHKWTHSEKELQELSEINDKIIEDEDIDSKNGDIDLYKKMKYEHENNNVLLKVKYEKFKDINPGNVGDTNSYIGEQQYYIDLKGPKIKLELSKVDKDKYEKLFKIEKRNEGYSLFDFETNNKLLNTVEYDKKYQWSLLFGKYYPFKKDEYFGYNSKKIVDYMFNNFNFELETKYIDIRKKEYEYDYTRDNDNFNNLFIDSETKIDSKIHKIYENGEKIRRAKKIIYEKYNSWKLNIGNDKMELPNLNSSIEYKYGIETRNYLDVQIPEFVKGRKILDDNSETKYKIDETINNKIIGKNPKALIHTFSTNVNSILLDTTNKRNSKYDIKIVNNTNISFQNSKVNDVKIGDNEIIETPNDIHYFNENFEMNIGNLDVKYSFLNKDEKHHKENWIKDRYIKNYFKINIDNKRYLSLDFDSNEEYEFKNYKKERVNNKKIEYGYISDKEDKIIYKYNEKNIKKYPYHTEYGWIRENYKELERERNIALEFNKWEFGYSRETLLLNDIFTTDFNNLPKGEPKLKLKTEKNSLILLYDSKKILNEKNDKEYYAKLSIGNEKKTYKNLNEVINNEDDYIHIENYTNIFGMYKYQNNEKNKESLEVELDVQLDGLNSTKKSDLKSVHRINAIVFKAKGGYKDKFMASYKYIMKRPDRINRNKPEEYSKYNFRKHELEGKYIIYKKDDKEWNISGKLEYVVDGAIKNSNSAIYESSYYAKKVNKITEGMIAVGHKFENLEWEIGGGVKWDKPNNKELGYYPVVMLKFGIVPFISKNIKMGYISGEPKIELGI